MIDSETAEMLLRYGWLSRTPPAFSALVLDRCVPVKRAAGEPLFYVGDEVGGLYGVVSGVMQIASRYASDDVQIVHLGHTGYWVGLGSAFTGTARQVGIAARSDFVVAYVSPAAINTIAAAGVDYWRHLAALTVENVNLAICAAADLMIRDVERRCLAVLLRVSDCRFAVPIGNPAQFAPITQDELAAMANLSRNAAGAVLRKYAGSGAIELGYRTIKVLKPQALRAIVNGG